MYRIDSAGYGLWHMRARPRRPQLALCALPARACNSKSRLRESRLLVSLCRVPCGLQRVGIKQSRASCRATTRAAVAVDASEQQQAMTHQVATHTRCVFQLRTPVLCL